MKRLTLIAAFAFGVIALSQVMAAASVGGEAKSLADKHLERVEVAINQAK
jgi:hypothetical protein